MPKLSAVRNQDRRSMGRQPSRLKLPCRVTRATEEGPWLATVRNISADGIGLVANRQFSPGTLLTVELPTRTRKVSEPHIMKVTHAKPHPTNAKWWVVGGFFAKRLGRDDLDHLKARSPLILPVSERRTGVRHTTRLKTACRLTLATEEGPWNASIRNISTRGIGLITHRPFKSGMLITVELPTLPSRSQRQGEPRLVKITHSRSQPGGQWWVLGGLFARQLGKDEVDALL